MAPGPRHGILSAAAALLLAGCLSATPPGSVPTTDPQDPTPAGHPHHHGLEAAPAPNASSGASPMDWDPDVAPNLTHEPPFPVQGGHRPSLEEAKAYPNRYSRFIAKGNEGFEKLRAEGHLAGDGTPARPYVLEKFYVDGELSLTNTNHSIVVREGYVAGQFKLNYIGPSVYVHHVYAKDLRVNENVKRTGTNTGGLFHDNAFGFVGQIRHFIGEFRNNEIGPRPEGVVASYLADSGVADVPPEVVFNFDGFHGADVHHNRFVGQVDIKLHGHNHGDCFACPIHNHADRAHFPGGAHDHGGPDETIGFRSHHSVRYVSLSFRDNEIVVPGGLALRYNDRNHAGDDRTANSEPNPFLEDPHVHYQDVTFARNRLLGGSFLLDVFNAADPHHPLQSRGIVRFLENEIVAGYEPAGPTGRPALVAGVRIASADGLELRIERTKVAFQEQGDDLESLGGAFGAPPDLRGIQFDSVDASNLTVRAVEVAEGHYGVYASKLTSSTHWWLVGNTFRTETAWRGQDVKNPPKEE